MLLTPRRVFHPATCTRSSTQQQDSAHTAPLSMDSIMETQRQSHEEIERYELAMAEVLLQPATTHRNKLRRERRAAELMERIEALKTTLKEQYADSMGLRAAELASLSAPAPGSTGDDLSEFYSRFEAVKQYHRDVPARNPKQFQIDLDEFVHGDGTTVLVDDEGHETIIDPLDGLFSGEEMLGRYLDLYVSHAQYFNILKGSVGFPYIAYLDMLCKGTVERHFSLEEKASAPYVHYLSTLHDYLLSYFTRVQPLINIQTELRSEEAEFEAAWDAGRIDGWTVKGKQAAVGGEGEQPIWCAYCQVHLAKRSVYESHIKSKKHLKNEAAGVAAPDAGASAPSGPLRRNKYYAPARLTHLVTYLLRRDPLPAVLKDTKETVERRSALTAAEREQEIEEMMNEEEPMDVVLEKPEEEDDDDSDDEGRIYNPLKLPLGWDGKPIPYWLYKLHGLGTEFRCQICSDFGYMGRKAFDRHFQESRHAFGMKSLGLPNTKHFHEITQIADALALAERLKAQGRQEMAMLEKQEEFEDKDGNVYDKKTYEDLKRQGLI